MLVSFWSQLLGSIFLVTYLNDGRFFAYWRSSSVVMVVNDVQFSWCRWTFFFFFILWRIYFPLIGWISVFQFDGLWRPGSYKSRRGDWRCWRGSTKRKVETGGSIFSPPFLSLCRCKFLLCYFCNFLLDFSVIWWILMFQLVIILT